MKDEYFFKVNVTIKLPRLAKIIVALIEDIITDYPKMTTAFVVIVIGAILHALDPEMGGSLLCIAGFLFLVFGNENSFEEYSEVYEEKNDDRDELVMLDEFYDPIYDDEETLRSIYNSLGLTMR